MAYYGNKSITRPRATGQPCDVCGQIPVGRWHKHADSNINYGSQLHAVNRIKIEPYYANHPRINRPDLANKRLCPQCAEALVFAPLNK